jgi:hypothetical protein
MYMIDGDYAYPVANSDVAFALTGTTMNTNQTKGPFVPDSWLSAFTPGGTIQVPTVPGAGDPVSSSLGNQPGNTIGDYGKTGSSYYIETGSGLVEVSQFVYTLYVSAPPAGVQPMTLSASAAAGASNNPNALDGTSPTWPQDVQNAVADATGNDGNYAVVCAIFTGSFDGGGVPHLSLYTGSNLPHPLSADGGISQQVQNAPQLANVMDVESGHAAIFQVAQSGTGKGTGTEYLLPSTGTMYPLAGKETFTQLNGKQTSASAAHQLGYDSLAAEGVPASFTNLVSTGQMLDPIKAGQTPPQLAGQ